MRKQPDVDVAVLLASFNGARYIEDQIRSLAANGTPFTLHWLDDHSTDHTREVLRTVAASEGIPLREWHQPCRQGVPGAFFQLLEKVEADVYLFCDQDDIWQPQKIDVTVDNLRHDIALPVLSCSDALLFRDDIPGIFYRYSQVAHIDPSLSLRESRLFFPLFVNGHTQGFTRSLRELFLRHKEIARKYACMHDEWMHVIATASGGVRELTNAPTTLYRWHQSNVSQTFGGWTGKGKGYMAASPRQLRSIRRAVARQAQGFILAASTLPPGPKLVRLIEIARFISDIDQRLPLTSVLRLIRGDIGWPNRRLSVQLALNCLYSHAH